MGNFIHRCRVRFTVDDVFRYAEINNGINNLNSSPDYDFGNITTNID